MQYVDFGRTGLRVSRLGFGGIPVQRIDEPGTRAMLKAAHEAGINYIDTARGSARRWRNWACGMNLSLPPSAVR